MIDQNLTTAIVSSSATALVAVVAIITNNKPLDDANKRLDDTNSRIGRLESKLDDIETPSPLLDWSHSPNVAAFFAFRRPVQIDEARDKSRSIYAFCETPEGGKGWWSDQPRIRRIGPYVRTHRRHFRQQTDYTICGNFESTYGVSQWCYARDEDVFAIGRSQQDVLWKFNIPSIEREKILNVLDGYNLNAFSLFDTEDTLMETLAFRELENEALK